MTALGLEAELSVFSPQSLLTTLLGTYNPEAFNRRSRPEAAIHL